MGGFHAEHIILIGSLLLIASLLASKTSFKLGIPTLILFLAIGMLAGSEGIVGIDFDNPNLAQLMGIVALNLILFSGGMDTRWESVRPVLRQGIALSTIGVLLTAATIGFFVHWVTDFTLLEGLLLGSIVSSTDAAAVFSILRTRSIGLKGNLRPLLELESGSNDPMAYVLTISFIYLISQGDGSATKLILQFVQQMVIGGVLGYVLGRLMTIAINRVKLETEGLYPVLIMAMIFFTFAFTDLIGGNGFLAVYLSALVLGNSNFIHKKSAVKFYDGQAWLMQIVMFLTLGLLVFPSRIIPIAGTGILIALVLIFVARPIGVFVALSFFRVKLRDKLFISWVGLRGAVPIVFATYPLIAGISKADTIFHLVFFISASSVLLQGTALPKVAKWLKVVVPKKAKRITPLDMELYDTIQSEFVEIILPGNSKAVGKAIVKLNLPKPSLIVLLVREGKYIQPNGATVLEEGDKLLLLANNKEMLVDVYRTLGV
ncbi:MAG TPA: potassium/proton antiporter [Chitinophagaceae bacterium]|nr:potassium/proton antiporter [Chitinophagaceae bacterium]